MAIITTNGSFGATAAVTSTTLNAVADAATFDDPVDGTSLELKVDGKLGIKDDGITPAKLSTGGPEWDSTGNLFVTKVVAPESADRLLIRSDPEAPGTGTDGGSQFTLYSSDSAFADQIFYRADFHTFNNIAGDVQGSIPYGAVPSQPQHFVRKDYVDAQVVFSQSFESPEANIPSDTSGITYSHGLSSTPKIIQVFLRCKIADSGYSVGDEVLLGDYGSSGQTQNSWASSTEVGWGHTYSGATVVISDKNANAFSVVSSPNFLLFIRAYA
jgi:hypothetical protein